MAESGSQITITPASRKRSRSRSQPRGKRLQRKRTSRTTVQTVLKRSVGFPRSKISTLKYNTQTTLNGGGGTTIVHTMSANSLYDPDRTGTGHQPSLYDTWNSIYNHYVVLKSTIKVEFVYPNTAITVPLLCGVYMDDNATLPGSGLPSLLIENGSKYLVFAGDIGAVKTIFHKFDAAKEFSCDPTTKDSISAGIGSNPAEEMYFNIWAADFNAGVYGTVYLNIDMEFQVLWSEPKDFAQS